MHPDIKIFSTPEQLAENFGEELYERIAKFPNDKYFNVALSGGNTPKILFKLLAKEFSEKINWKKVKLFWADERCVPPENPDSNYGMTKEILLNNINIPGENVFRINGEDDPNEEVIRYSSVVKDNVEWKNGIPSFNLIILGLGEDGHTASIFPNQIKLINSDKIYETSIYSDTRQERITITGKVINNARWIVFLVTGKNKADVISKILKRQNEAKAFPSFYVSPNSGKLDWYIDKEASGNLDRLLWKDESNDNDYFQV